MTIVLLDCSVTPWEDWRLGLGFAKRMPTDATISTVDSVVVKNATTGADVTSTIFESGSTQIDNINKRVSGRFHAFVDAVTYLIIYKITLSNGEKREGGLRVPCSAS